MSHDSCVVSLSFSDRIFDSLFNFEVHPQNKITSSDLVKEMNDGPKPQLCGTRGCSSSGRAPALQAGGKGFDPPHLHHGSSGPKKS